MTYLRPAGYPPESNQHVVQSYFSSQLFFFGARAEKKVASIYVMSCLMTRKAREQALDRSFLPIMFDLHEPTHLINEGMQRTNPAILFFGFSISKRRVPHMILLSLRSSADLAQVFRSNLVDCDVQLVEAIYNCTAVNFFPKSLCHQQSLSSDQVILTSRTTR